MFFSLLDPFFWLNFFYFLFASTIAFFIPGDTFLSRLKLEKFQRITLGILMGVAMWVWQGFVFGFLGLRFLTYVYLVFFLILWFTKNKKNLKFSSVYKKKISIDILLVLILFLGVFVQTSSVWFTGIKISQGVYFCCGNIGDSLYHIALTNQIVKQVPPYEPGMDGVVVRNYHYLSNLINAELIRIFRLPLVATQYQFMTVAISLFLGLSAISFSKVNKLSKQYIYWLLFFLYFGGDFIYLVLIFLGKGLSFSMGSLEDGSIFLVNPPRAFAVVLFFTFLTMFSIWLKKKDVLTGIAIGIIGATLVGLKVYIGIAALIGISSVSFYFLFKKEYKIIIPLILTFSGSAMFYLPVNSQAGGLYFTSFWLFENFIVQPQFGLGHMELAKNIFKEHNNWLRVAQYELTYFLIYIFSIFGTKIIGLFQTGKSLSKIPAPIHVILISGFSVSLVIGFFFQQESGGSNTFNFIVSVFILSSIYAALAVSYWLNRFNKKISLVLGLIIILLTIPRVVNQVYQNIEWVKDKKGFTLTNDKLDAVNYLKKNTADKSLILVDSSFADIDENSPLVSFIADRPMFLSGKGILDSHNIPTKKRDTIKREIVRGDNAKTVADRILNNNVDYVLTSSERPVESTESAEFLTPVFINNKAIIYKKSPDKLKDFLDKIKQNEK